ncbi:MAG TPA: hypothetical protein VFU41_06335 [Gemmatimonadales bacterium]|nr:hypothetical protein [Gemmatimonadales bacterium]
MGLAASLCACLSERPRPGPPTISFSLNKETVQSRNPPDTLIVNVRAADPDGLDSVWVQLANGPLVGADGLFDEVLEGPFRVTVPPGLPQGSVLPVTVRARDVVGFESERDTTVRVGP